MMQRTILAMVVPAVLFPATLLSGGANAAEIYNKDANKVDFYGKVVGEHGWTFDKKNANHDSSYARIGIKGETQINSQLSGYGQWEYNMDASDTEGAQPTKTRLAFAGLNFGNYGTFDYGRNDGVVYDAEAATDNFVVWGGDGWNDADRFMTSRATGVATYRNQGFFGLVDGLAIALQYQGKNDSNSRSPTQQNGDGFSTSITYDLPAGFGLALAYANSNRTVKQKEDGKGSKAEATAFSVKYDANNVYAAMMYGQTYNMVPQANDEFANKTKNFEVLLQYQFDFGLRPSIGYLQSRGEDLEKIGTFKGGGADLAKYVEVGAWYYFNKNMNVYAAYQFNLLSDNDYAKAVDLSTDNQATVGITYQF